jgi:glycine/D-amino acid oxidase-like deaminating enzyme
MPTKSVDYVIIGGGIVGLSAAHALATRKAGKIVVLERGLLASGGTGQAAGTLLLPSAIKPIVRLYQQSYAFYRDFAQQVGGSCGFVPLPMVMLSGEADLPALREVIQTAQAATLTMQEIPVADLPSLVPDLSVEGINRVAYSPDSGTLDPLSAAWSLGGAAQALGVEIISGLPDSTALELLHDGHRVTGVRTAGDIHYQTRVVLLAAGIETSTWLRALGLRDPLRRERYHLTALRTPSGSVPPSCVIADMTSGTDAWHSRPGGSRLMVVGGMRPRDEDGTQLPHSLSRRLPALAATPPTRTWSVEVDVTPDGGPLLGMLPFDGLYVAAGLGAWGLSLAPAVGHLMAGMMTDDYAAIERLVPLRYARFEDHMALQPQFRFGADA